MGLSEKSRDGLPYWDENDMDGGNEKLLSSDRPLSDIKPGGDILNTSASKQLNSRDNAMA